MKVLRAGIVVGVLMLSTSLVFPVHAATVSELEKVIIDLRAQIAELTQKLQANAVSANPTEVVARKPEPLPDFSELKPSRYGEYSGSVRTLQNELAARGYYDGPVTGRYAKLTQAAVAAFQRDSHLAGNGRFAGAETITYITDSLCSLSVSVSPRIPKAVWMVGTDAVSFVKIKFTTPKTCAVDLKKITLTVDTKESAVSNVLKNVTYVLEGSDVPSVTIQNPSWVNSESFSTVSIPAGTSVTLAISADIVGIGSGEARIGVSYVEAVKKGTTVYVGGKGDYFGEWMTITPPPDPEPEDPITSSDTEDLNGN